MNITRAQALRGALSALVAAVASPALAQPGRSGGRGGYGGGDGGRGGGNTNGRNVTVVNFNQGSYVQLPYGRWEERGVNGGRFTFQESHRDDWSVYLNDNSRGVRIQLDLHTRQIMYSDRGAPQMRPLYQITDSSSDVNGWNVTSVRFPQGTYRMTGPGQWGEFGDNGGRFNFTENQRDDWSVYLVDRSRNVEIQLDLYQRKIMYNEIGQPRRPLYEVTGSSAR